MSKALRIEPGPVEQYAKLGGWLDEYKPGIWHKAPARQALFYLAHLNGYLEFMNRSTAAGVQLAAKLQAVVAVTPASGRRYARVILRCGIVTVQFLLSDDFEPFTKRPTRFKAGTYAAIPASAVRSCEFRWRRPTGRAA